MSIPLPDYESLRLSYKPSDVKVLLVGEPQPEGWGFFYHADSPLAGYTKQALAQVYDEAKYLWGTDFLKFFKARGFYMEDLCREPVDGKGRLETKAPWRREAPDLGRKIAEWRPKAVIGILLGTLEPVRDAVARSGVKPIEFKAVPFPSNGWQNTYVNGVAEFLRELRAKGVL